MSSSQMCDSYQRKVYMPLPSLQLHVPPQGDGDHKDHATLACSEVPQSPWLDMTRGPAATHLPDPPFPLQTAQVPLQAVLEGLGEGMGQHHLPSCSNYFLIINPSRHPHYQPQGSQMQLPPNHCPAYGRECNNCSSLHHYTALCRRPQRLYHPIFNTRAWSPWDSRAQSPKDSRTHSQTHPDYHFRSSSRYRQSHSPSRRRHSHCRTNRSPLTEQSHQSPVFPYRSRCSPTPFYSKHSIELIPAPCTSVASLWPSKRKEPG